MLRLDASLGPIVDSWREAVRFLSVLKRFQAHLRPQLWPMSLAVLASLGFTVVTLLEPWPLQIIFDGVLLNRPVEFLGIDLTPLATNRPLALLAAAAAAVLLLAALRGQFYYVQRVRAATAGLDVVMGIRRDLFHHLQTLSMSFHRKSQTGDLLMRLTGDIVMLREMVVAAMITLLTQGLVVLGILIIMATLNLRLTLIACVVVPLLFVTLSIFRLRLVDAARRQRKREGRLASTVHEVLGGIQVVQAFTAEKSEDKRFKQMNTRSLRSGVRVTRLEAQLNRSVEISIALGICLILWLGARDVLAGKLSPGQLLVFLAYVRSLYRPLRQASKLTQRLAKASACGDRVIDVLNRVPEIQDPPDPITLRRLEGRITFRSVSFAYRRDEPVLRGIDLELHPGETVAIVGPSGEGKTTLLSLVPRFLDPTDGVVLVDDVPVRAASLKSLRRQISFVPQEATIMGISIRENIAYGATHRRGGELEHSKIEKAARRARAHDFIQALPNGYDTVVGERGATLSAGQRQRIAIARALLKKSPILLMDEPMTGIDPVSVEAVLDALDNATRNRTTLVIAHHLSTVLRADRIVFLEGGRIVEDGTHEGLLAGNGSYAHFFRSEFSNLATGA